MLSNSGAVGVYIYRLHLFNFIKSNFIFPKQAKPLCCHNETFKHSFYIFGGTVECLLIPTKIGIRKEVKKMIERRKRRMEDRRTRKVERM